MVKKIQKLVNTEVDGVFGKNTLKAVSQTLSCENSVKSVQKRVKTTADGIIGPNTLKAILNELQSLSEPKKDKAKIRIALLPGHSKKDGGAVMVSGLKYSEFTFANKYIPEVKKHLEDYGYEVVITCRENAGGTTPSYSAKAANTTNADAAFEFHFNSAGPTARGCEFLYKAGNSKYKEAAKIMGKEWSRLTGIKHRGELAVCNAKDTHNYNRATSRGSSAFTRSNMFFCMTEPFFSSNPEECALVTNLYKSGEWSKYMAYIIKSACDTIFDV